MADSKAEISELTLGLLIEKTPLAFRREVIERVEKVELALIVTGIKDIDWHEALNRYRGFRAKPELLSNLLGVHFFNPILMEYLRDLDDTFRRIKNFKPEEFITKAVISSVSARAAKVGRKNSKTREEKLMEIGNWLKLKRYQQSTNKNDLVREAERMFHCGETDVRDAAKKLGLVRTYRKSSS